MKRINSSYKLIEFLSGGGSGADTVINVATVEVRFGAVVLIEKLVFNVAYEKIGVHVAGSHFGAHGHAIDLLSYFFVKKIPLSRRVEYVMDGSTDQ